MHFGNSILVWTYKNKNLDYSEGVKLFRMECGGSADINGVGSFKWSYEKPGVYLCTGGCDGNMCFGHMTEAITSSQDQLDSPFKGNVTGVRIVNDTSSGTYYQAVLHKEIGLENGGECSMPIVSTENISCTETWTYAFSADINPVNITAPYTSGNGVSFYNETYGWNPDKASGEINITKEQINVGYGGSAPNMYFDFSKVKSTVAFLCNEGYPPCSDAYKNTNTYSNEELLYYFVEGNCCPCPTLQDCPGSIRIKGDYFVGLYSYPKDENGDRKKDERGNPIIYCQIFAGKKDVENLSKYNYVLPGVDLANVFIVPIKQ